MAQITLKVFPIVLSFAVLWGAIGTGSQVIASSSGDEDPFEASLCNSIFQFESDDPESPPLTEKEADPAEDNHNTFSYVSLSSQGADPHAGFGSLSSPTPFGNNPYPPRTASPMSIPHQQQVGNSGVDPTPCVWVSSFSPDVRSPRASSAPIKIAGSLPDGPLGDKNKRLSSPEGSVPSNGYGNGTPSLREHRGSGSGSNESGSWDLSPKSPDSTDGEKNCFSPTLSLAERLNQLISTNANKGDGDDTISHSVPGRQHFVGSFAPMKRVRSVSTTGGGDILND